MKKRGGFTFLEIMVVMVVIAVLATIAIPTYSNFVKRAKRVEAQQSLSEIGKRETVYFIDNGVYSNDLVAVGFDTTKLKYYTISVAVGVPPDSFVATATGNIDRDGDLDVWTIDETTNLNHVSID
ncbi:MAG: type IV pilin protein [Thermodesulfobacteriota bacterium]